MRLCRGIFFLLFVMQGPVALQSQHTETDPKEGLHCYTCYATTSWEDCNKNKTVERCPEDDNEVCVTMKLHKWDKNKKPITEYVKHCSAASYCSDEECKNFGYTCTIHCCNEDFCNTSFTIAANIMLVMVISCLQSALH